MILSVLDHFTSLGGQYVSWKNNHEIKLALSGESDLDIYVPKNQKTNFIDYAKKEGWFIVENPVAHYPDIYHFYKIDENLKNHHLHVYFEIITGESWLKEYNFPIGDFLLENSELHSSGIYILNKKTQAFLFVLRHFIKNYSQFSRTLYKRELQSYQEEWRLCKSDFNASIYPNLIDFEPFMANSGLQDTLSLPSKKTSKKVREQLKGYLRFPKAELTPQRINSFKTRLLNKLFYKRKKVLPKEGFILAFSGADGVGKSTMSESIGEAYASFLTVKTVQLGKPQNGMIDKLRALLNKSSSTNNSVSTAKSSKKTSFKKAVMATYLARLRHKEAQKALKYKKQRYLVISDRWPTDEYYKMDGPKLEVELLTGFKKRLALLEQKYYEKIINSDLTIILTVPVAVAIKRNQDRVKAGKETDDEIKTRHFENAEHSPIAKKIIRFDNNGELREKRSELIQIIQSKLFQNSDYNDY